jgi:predicted nucleotidyltransferase
MGMKKTPSRKGTSPSANGIADALFTKVQQRVLGVLFGNPGRSFFANEVIALAGSGTGAVQRELTRLAAVELVTVKRVGKQKHYQANAAAPVYEELRGLVLKTSGLADVLRAALAPLAGQISAGFVYGSLAKSEDTAASDIDLMVVSESLSYADLFATLEAAAGRLGRKVNPTVYSPQDLAKRLKQHNAFVTRVLAQPKIWLIGGERDLAA